MGAKSYGLKMSDLYAMIPNQSDVDKLAVERAFLLFKALKRFEEQLPHEDLTHEHIGKDGEIRTVSNPFFKDYLSLLSAFSKILSELGLTPRSRKALIDSKIETETTLVLKKR